MTDQDYGKLDNTVRQYKKMLKKNNPELFKKREDGVDNSKEMLDESLEGIQIGNRVQILEKEVRGEVRYLGKVPDLGLGVFIGVALDEPFGNVDGSLNGVKYFDCYPRYGLFLRKTQIEVGDFPELEMDEF